MRALIPFLMITTISSSWSTAVRACEHNCDPQNIVSGNSPSGQFALPELRSTAWHAVMIMLRKAYALAAAADKIQEGIDASRSADLAASKLHALMLEEKRELRKLSELLDKRLRTIENRLNDLHKALPAR